MSQQAQTKKFIKKLYQILEMPQNQSYISWDSHQNKVVIKDTQGFQQNVIPKHFRLQKLASFIRQLHLYDFHKLKAKGEFLIFSHPNFIRGFRQNLRFIRRKRLTKAQKQQKKLLQEEQKIQKQQNVTPVPSEVKIEEKQSQQGVQFCQQKIKLEQYWNPYQQINMSILQQIQFEQFPYNSHPMFY